MTVSIFIDLLHDNLAINRELCSPEQHDHQARIVAVTLFGDESHIPLMVPFHALFSVP